MKEDKEMMCYLKEEAEKLKIPQNITPQEIRKKLEEMENKKDLKEECGRAEKKKYRSKKRVLNGRKVYEWGYVVAAVCLCLVVGTALVQKNNRVNLWESNIRSYPRTETTEESNQLADIQYPIITYEDIYKSMFGNLNEINIYNGEFVEGNGSSDGIMRFEGDTMPKTSASNPATSDGIAENIVYQDSSMVKESVSGIFSDDAVMEKAAKESSIEYGTTNIQTEGVEEADVIKNDGRYLYQKIYQEKEHVITQAIQIIDTKDGLREVIRIEGFDNIQEFYIWEDILVIIENKYLETVQTNNATMEKLMLCGVANYSYSSNQYHEITFYNIKNRSMPNRIHTFTLKGTYDSSRISDGYFYGFSRFYASPGEGEEDYAAYIPVVDGVQLDAGQILLPGENAGNCYLVLTSIDMNNPTKFLDTTAVVTDSDMYYVSSNNIYIADRLRFEEGIGWKINQISLFRFSYEKGKFALQAEGKIPGSLESSFSMDEYQGNLRLVTTVDEYFFEELKDDRTGEVIGNHIADERRSNALYVLNQKLEIIGKIENLAQDERIYSARFLGETGYFVTFRQTDPLFAVDLKDPKNPQILSELKVSGFSEYLHFYGENRLLGIGMEADVETGSTDGMKLSMFDISNPEEVQEIAKLSLKQYYESEALYNHRAVMISVNANLFGFEAIGRENGKYKKNYLVFSYENDKFVQRMNIETDIKYVDMYSSRGTFIGNVFYLLTRDGSVTSYNLNTGEKLEMIEKEIAAAQK